ncbi:sulfotransferase domain-containing protein [Aquimarina sp. 2201CG5-10]|uniref:sulfotransferase domain-containing protein n=1 Tax=Aquimarina callyspongiae TaxID=3098150 RepID=UPI002AB58D13|nr:sulfotransferase domain-containing protein [Aquimarina sp. 2201CG5-10]MDY8138860.1 sulfotransferase domain-containing protein [Aquimarina sp. 2201CG5-10]
MSKKNIIIVGYPKSGTTWISRLVAELVQCPLRGDWGYEDFESLYTEGNHRDSSFQCFKSHHEYQEINTVSNLTIHKVIYIIRDPRDIVISGMHYFRFTTRYISVLKRIRLHTLEQFLREKFNQNLSLKKKKKRMIQAVLYKGKNVNRWLKPSWKKHYQGYLNKNILFITYENLLNSPKTECDKIMKYLDIVTTSDHIKQSIEKQSFRKRKKEVLRQDDSSLKKLIRKGSSGYWKEEFTEKEIFLFREVLKTSDEFYKF